MTLSHFHMLRDHLEIFFFETKVFFNYSNVSINPPPAKFTRGSNLSLYSLEASSFARKFSKKYDLKGSFLLLKPNRIHYSLIHKVSGSSFQSPRGDTVEN